jgi:hypothetical protein
MARISATRSSAVKPGQFTKVGKEEGLDEMVGKPDCVTVGSRVGALVGNWVNTLEETDGIDETVGVADGSENTDGPKDGALAIVGSKLSTVSGGLEGTKEGRRGGLEGTKEGRRLGASLGIKLGLSDGVVEGESVGILNARRLPAKVPIISIISLSCSTAASPVSFCLPEPFSEDLVLASAEFQIAYIGSVS